MKSKIQRIQAMVVLVFWIWFGDVWVTEIGE
jgi:hypothetical protein